MSGVACDVASPSSVQRLVELAAVQLGRIDVWINNAGCSGSFQVRPAPVAVHAQYHGWPALLWVWDVCAWPMYLRLGAAHSRRSCHSLRIRCQTGSL